MAIGKRHLKRTRFQRHKRRITSREAALIRSLEARRDEESAAIYLCRVYPPLPVIRARWDGRLYLRFRH